MHLTTTSRRTAGALGTTVLAAIITVGPAHARQDAGELLEARDTRPDGSILQYSSPQPSAPVSEAVSRSGPAATTVDDNAVEYLQIALGALGGMAVVGGMVAAGSVRRHGHAHPA